VACSKSHAHVVRDILRVPFQLTSPVGSGWIESIARKGVMAVPGPLFSW